MKFEIMDCYKSFGSQDIFQNLSLKIKKDKKCIIGYLEQVAF